MPRSCVEKLKQWNDGIKKTIDEVKCGKSIHKAVQRITWQRESYIKQLKNTKRELIDISYQSIDEH